MTITEFLLARIAEDEDGNITRFPPAWYGPEPGRPRSARVVRECEAKRRIVERSEFLVSEGAYPDLTRRERSWTLTTLCVLAAVYADHPDYDPAWVTP